MRGFILVFVCVISDGLAQQHVFYSPVKGRDIPNGMVGTYFGIEHIDDGQLNSWLRINGVERKQDSYLMLGFMFLFERKKYCLGFEGSGSYAKDPNSSSYNVVLLLGRRFSFKQFDLLPLVGLGLSDHNFTFSNSSIPLYLQSFKVGAAVLTENEFLVNPRVLAFRTTGKLVYGLELGLKTTFFPSEWTYGNYGQVSGIPHASSYNPYFSIFVGVGKWK